MLELFSANNFILLFQMLYIFTALGTVIVIISENRNPLKTISWVLVLLFLPLVGLIIYYFFGEDGRKQRLISHKMHNQLNKKSLNLSGDAESVEPPMDYKGLVTLLDRDKDAPLYGGSKVTF